MWTLFSQKDIFFKQPIIKHITLLQLNGKYQVQKQLNIFGEKTKNSINSTIFGVKRCNLYSSIERWKYSLRYYNINLYNIIVS